MIELNKVAAPVTPSERMAEVWRETGSLLLSECLDCHALIAVPRSRCPKCWSVSLQDRNDCRSGAISSYSAIWRGLPDEISDQAPILIAEINLECGVRIISRVILGDHNRDFVGVRVELVTRREARNYPLPTFRICD